MKNAECFHFEGSDDLKKYKPDILDTFTFGGLIIFGTGIWFIYPPAALIFTGLFFMWLGLAGD
jgi:hypothetical protein